MKTYFAFCVFLSLLVGCTNRDTKKVRIVKAPVTVDIAPASDTLRLSDYFRSCTLLELKGTLLSEINDVKLTEDFIIIQSKAQGKDLHVFDRQGNFLRSLIRCGRANDEVLNIQAFCYNEYLGTVDVLCNYGMEIRQIALDGDRFETIKLPEKSIFSAKDVETGGASTYILYKDIGFLDIPEHKLYVYDYKKDSVAGRFIPFDRQTEEKISFSQRNNLYRKDGSVYFYEVFQNGIFEVRQDGIEPFVAFRKNGYTFPSELFSASRDFMDLIGRCKSHHYIWAHVNCTQYRNLIFSFFTCSSKTYANVIDLEQKKARSFLYLEDDLFTHTVLPASKLNIIGSTRDGLICDYGYCESLPENASYLLFLR